MDTYKLLYFSPTDGPVVYVVSAEVMAAVRVGKLPEVSREPPVIAPPVVVEPPVATPPPTPKELTFLPPTWDGKQVFFHSEGGDGTPVLYSAIGITKPTAGPIAQTTPYPADLRDKSQFYLEQSGKKYGPFPYDMRLVTAGATTQPIESTKPTSTGTKPTDGVTTQPVSGLDEANEDTVNFVEGNESNK